MGRANKAFDPQKVRLGITPSLWWNDDFPLLDVGISFEQCISEMALAGFQGCSSGRKYPTDANVLRSALELRGLRLAETWVSTYFTISNMREQTLRSFQQQKALSKALDGTTVVVSEFGQAVNPLPVALFANRPTFNNSQWSALTSGLEELGRIANDNGLRLCYHPHLGTGVMIQSDIERLLDSTKPELVSLAFDTGHVAFAGGDPLAVARRYGSRIKHVHLKDVRFDVIRRVREENLSFREAIEAGVFTVPGDGALDFGPIFDALADARFEGWIVVEADQNPANANPLKYAKMARQFLRDSVGW